MAVSITVFSKVSVGELKAELAQPAFAEFLIPGGDFFFGPVLEVGSSKAEVLRDLSIEFDFTYKEACSYFLVFMEKKSAAGEIRWFVQWLSERLEVNLGPVLCLINGETPYWA
jgi:hypothetical protein